MGTLPNLTIDTTGRHSDGEHWHGAKRWNYEHYRATFQLTPGTRLATATLVCESTDDALTMIHLSPGAQMELLRHLGADTSAGLDFAPGLTRTYVWRLGNPTNRVALSGEDLEQVALWLRYATGELTYDGDSDEFCPN